MKSINLVDNLQGKYVLLRTSLNIPMNEKCLRNRFRLERALPTLRYLHEQGAKTILVAHIGRDPKETLKPVYDELEKYLPMHWGGPITVDGFRQRHDLMTNGDILVAENLRQDEREVNNEESFVELLANQAELYVNDAFAAVHREHASTYGVASKLPAYAGLTLVEEVRELSKAMAPIQPSVFLLGGAKFETKLPLIEKYLKLYDKVFIGGALANDIFKAKGFEVGQSLVSDMSLKDSPILEDPNLLIPIDVIVDGPKGRQVRGVNQVEKEEKILDCGPMTVDMLATYFESAKTILWNGPLGAYEQGFTQGTEITARYIAGSEAFSVVGGGDTVAAIESLQLNDLFGFVSIGGGSMLTFLENGTTPVLKLLSGE